MEIREAMRILAPQQFVLLAPMAENAYEDFRESITVELRSLPARKGSGTAKRSSPNLPAYRSADPSPPMIQALIYFTPDWVPRFIPLEKPPFWLSTYRMFCCHASVVNYGQCLTKLSVYELENRSH